MRQLMVERLSVERGARRVLDEVSFDVRSGEVVAVIGANGAGKTTLLEAIAGVCRRAGRTGSVRWDGGELRGLRDAARTLSFLPDGADPPAEVRVATLVAHAARWGGAPDAVWRELLTRLGLDALRGARAGELSRGERRRVALFGALATARPVIVLDEPLGTFDPLQLLDVLALLRERATAGAALLLSVHQMADAEKVADRVLILHEGRVLAFGPLADLRAPTLEATFLGLLGHARA